MAAPAFESYSTAGAALNDVSSVDVAAPSGSVEGDHWLALVQTNAPSATITTPSGWTLLESLVEAGSGTHRLSVFSRFAPASPGSTTFDFGSATDPIAVIVRTSGVDATTPVDVSDIASGVLEDTAVAPDVTTTVSDTLVYRICAWNNPAGTLTSPSTERWKVEETAGGNRAAHGSSAEQATAGATGTADFTCTLGRWVAATVALRPAAGGATGAITEDAAGHSAFAAVASTAAAMDAGSGASDAEAAVAAAHAALAEALGSGDSSSAFAAAAALSESGGSTDAASAQAAAAADLGADGGAGESQAASAAATAATSEAAGAGESEAAQAAAYATLATDGPEIVTNGGFATDTAGWTAPNSTTLSSVSGRLRVAAKTGAGGNQIYGYQTVAVTSGFLYRASVDGFVGTSTNWHIIIADTGTGNPIFLGGDQTADGHQELVFQAAASEYSLRLNGDSTIDGDYVEFDNASLVLLTPGAHVGASDAKAARAAASAALAEDSAASDSESASAATVADLGGDAGAASEQSSGGAQVVSSTEAGAAGESESASAAAFAAGSEAAGSGDAEQAQAAGTANLGEGSGGAASQDGSTTPMVDLSVDAAAGDVDSASAAAAATLAPDAGAGEGPSASAASAAALGEPSGASDLHSGGGAQAVSLSTGAGAGTTFSAVFTFAASLTADAAANMAANAVAAAYAKLAENAAGNFAPSASAAAYASVTVDAGAAETFNFTISTGVGALIYGTITIRPLLAGKNTIEAVLSGNIKLS